MSTPHPDGVGAQDARAAWLPPALHRLTLGTSTLTAPQRWPTTVLGDGADGVFGERGVPVSSTKGITGHALGAAGIVEAIITTQALERQSLPPSANLSTPDPLLPSALVTAADYWTQTCD
jgi:hypothetical protein